MKQLENKIALITGGNSGIGLATAKLFHEQGARVITTARAAETYAIAQKEFDGIFRVIQADVSKVSELKNLASTIKKEFGKLDVVFANAGISKIIPVQQFDESAYDQLFDTNVKGVFYTIQQTADLLTDVASVIINASAAASMGFAGGSVYGATKAAVQSFTRHFAAEFASRKIRFNSISPSLIETSIADKLGLDPETVKKFMEFATKNPSGRIGQPPEVAQAVLFLASELSSYINGVDLSIDGGTAAVTAI